MTDAIQIRRIIWFLEVDSENPTESVKETGDFCKGSWSAHNRDHFDWWEEQVYSLSS